MHIAKMAAAPCASLARLALTSGVVTRTHLALRVPRILSVARIPAASNTSVRDFSGLATPASSSLLNASQCQVCPLNHLTIKAH